MIESTLRFDDVEVIPGLLPLLGGSKVTNAVKRTEWEMAWERGYDVPAELLQHCLWHMQFCICLYILSHIVWPDVLTF